MLSYSDGKETHPRRSFSTETTAYSHWRGLSELIRIKNNHCRQQYVLRMLYAMMKNKIEGLKYLCQVIENL
jgi:hypothetical protein